MLSRYAREFAAEIANHDWSDSPYRLDRAGHQRTFDKGHEQMPRLTEDETGRVRTNVMWVAAQVLGHADPGLDVAEFARACGVDVKSGIVRAGLRVHGGVYAKPGTYEYEEAPAASGIAWICQSCGKPIADGVGGLMMSHTATEKYEDAVRAWTAAYGHKLSNTMGELGQYPDAVCWRVLHFECGPVDDLDDYVIGVETARTPWALVDWTSHLMGKAWLKATDWEELLRSAVARAPRSEVGRSVGS